MALIHQEEVRKAEEEESGTKAESITPVRRVKTEETCPQQVAELHSAV